MPPDPHLDELPAPLAEPDGTAARHRADRSARRNPLRPGLLWPLGALALLAVLGVRASRAGARPVEGVLAAQGFSLTGTRAGLADPVLSPDGFGALQTAVYATLTRAFARHDSLVAAGRELLVVTGLAAAVLVWRTGRRLGLGDASCALAVLLAGVPAFLPPAALVGSPARLAVPWLLLAGCLVAPGRPTVSARVAATAAALVGVLLAPPAALLLLAGAAARFADGGRPSALGRWRWAAALVAAAGFVVVLLLLDRWDPRPATADAWGIPAAAVWATTAVCGVAGLLAARRPTRLRAAGIALAATAVVALLPPGRLAVLAVCLPLAALVVATLLSTPLVGAAAPGRVLAVAAGAALVVTAAAAVVVPGPGAAPPDARAHEALLGWAAAQLPEEAVLVAGRRAWAELVHSGGTQDEVRLAGGGPAVPGPVLAVSPDDAPAGTLPLARFDSPGAAAPLVVADTAPGVPTDDELDSRQRLAAAILDNPTTEAGPQADAVLTAAAVDARLLTLLAALVARSGVGIDSFPPAPGEPGEPGAGPPARRMLLTSMGGEELRAGSDATGALLEMLDAQLPPFAPDQVTAGEDGVLVGFRYDSSPDAVVTAAR